MVHMKLGGRPESIVLIINDKRFLRNCYCCPPEEMEDGEGDDEGGRDTMAGGRCNV